MQAMGYVTLLDYGVINIPGAGNYLPLNLTNTTGVVFAWLRYYNTAISTTATTSWTFCGKSAGGTMGGASWFERLRVIQSHRFALGSFTYAFEGPNPADAMTIEWELWGFCRTL